MPERRAFGTRPGVLRLVHPIVLVVSTLIILTDLATTITTVTGRFILTFGGGSSALPLSSLPLLQQADLQKGSHGTLADAALSLRLVGAAPSLIHAVIVLAATIFLLFVLRGIRAATPFDRSVLRNWRRLSLTLLGGGALQGLVATAGWIYLGSRIGLLFGSGGVSDQDEHHFLGGNYTAIGLSGPTWPMSILVAGIVALALAAAFRQGALLEEQAEGIV